MRKILMILLAFLLLFPAAGFTMKHMEHGKDEMKGMEHGKDDMKGMDHGSMKMDMDGDAIMLQNHEVDKVTGMAHLLDVREKMAEHGMTQTHHLMVGFKDAAGNPVTEGKAAVKVESPDGKESKPIMMMGMDGAFGADIQLDQQGMYHFKVGTKLADGTKRTYHFHYEN